MLKNLRARALRVAGGFVGLLLVAGLVIVPASPAAAIQNISWTTSPPATATLNQQVSFAWSGTANTFLGARITGCFANYPNGGNYTNSFGGNFTTGSCSVPNKQLTLAGTYPITVGFTLSTGGQMTMSWNVAVSAPTPVVIVPSAISTAATSVSGAVATFSSSAADVYYGSYSATCTPASGSTFAVGTTTVTCSATNPGGKTGTASFPVTVTKGTPTLLWSTPSSVTYGTTYNDLATATMQAADASGTIAYTRADGTAFSSNDPIPVGSAQILQATYAPSGAAAQAYTSVVAERTVTVVRAASAVAFDSGTPTIKRFGDAPFTVQVTGTTGAGAVAVSAQAGSVCTVSDATVTLTGAGTCVLLADQVQTSTHSAAPTAQWSVTVEKGNPQISWAPPATLTYGAPVSDLLGATTDVPGTFAYLVNGTVVAPETVLDVSDLHTVSVIFTPTDAGNYVEASDSHDFAIVPAAQTLTVGAITDQTFGAEPFDIVVGGTGPGVVSATATGACTVDGLTVTLIGAGECTLEISKASTSNHLAAASVTRNFAIDRAAQTLTVEQIADREFSAASVPLEIGGTGPGVVTATASGACTETGLAVTVTDGGVCTITVDKAGTSNYLPAASVIRAFTVTRVLPVLVDAALAPGRVGVSYNAPITAEPTDATTYTITAGTLPAGLTIAPATGVISGTPTASGSFGFTVTATNTGGSVTADYTIQVALAAGTIGVVAKTAFTSPGAKATLTVSKLAPNEPFAVSLRGVVVAQGTALASGKQTIVVTVPKTAAVGKTSLEVTGSTADRRGAASQTIVAAAKKLTFTVSPRPIVQSNRTLTITVRGLADGEPVKVTFRGKTVSPKTAKANSKGNYTVKVSAGWSWGYKPITATGSSPKRYGATKIDVERRR